MWNIGRPYVSYKYVGYSELLTDMMLQDYKFKSIYKFVNIVYSYVDRGIGFWNFEGNQFINSALRFNKFSLLHLYVITTLGNHFRREFRKNGDCIEEDEIEWWIEIMKEYEVGLTKRGYKNKDNEDAFTWYQKNEKLFWQFYKVISKEVVHILFNDKLFLQRFNELVRCVIIDEEGIYSEFMKWPAGTRNENGTIKRCSIPQWVKKAVFYRDKGRCVFCNKDLTGLVNIWNNKNYDHIIPLKQYGANDPCNIQLTCVDCNLSKGGNEKTPYYRYQTWW